MNIGHGGTEGHRHPRDSRFRQRFHTLEDTPVCVSVRTFAYRDLRMEMSQTLFQCFKRTVVFLCCVTSSSSHLSKHGDTGGLIKPPPRVISYALFCNDLCPVFVAVGCRLQNGIEAPVAFGICRSCSNTRGLVGVPGIQGCVGSISATNC